MKYTFDNSSWKNDFSYAYSLVATSYCEFSEASDHIHNGYNEEIGGYDYISIVHCEKGATGDVISTKCSFDSYGAPLLTFANEVWTDGEGHLRYGDHYEIVAYENGCNVWRITRAPEGSTRPFVAENCLRLRFPMPENTPFTLRVELLAKRFRVELAEASFDLPAPFLGEEVYIGLTACEGVNRFYEMEIQHNRTKE